MKKSNLSIKKLFTNLHIKKGDNIIIHGDAGVVEQLNWKSKEKFKRFSQEILKCIGKNGTLLVPSFTHSFCKNKVFDPENQKSEVGLFSENFRKLKEFKRTKHPIYSFSIFGKNKDYYEKSDHETCFGKNSVFDLFLKKKGKIISFGSPFEDSVTFLHYIEQQAKVKYRYFKKFEGHIKNKKSKKRVKTIYFVRNLKKNKTFIMPSGLFKIIKKKTFGRYLITSIEAKKLYSHCIKKLKSNDNYLIEN